MEMKTFGCIFYLLLLTVLIKAGSVAPRGRGGKSVMCFFKGESVVHQREEVRFTPEDLDVDICTHLVYDRAVLNAELEVVPKNRAVDLLEDDGKGLYNRTVALKRRKPDLKVILDVSDNNGKLAVQVALRNTSAYAVFAANAADYVQRHGFDGMYSRLIRHTEGYDELVAVVSEEFSRRGLLMTSFLLPHEGPGEPQFELTEAVSRYLDLIIVGSYWKVPRDKTEIFSSLKELERIVDAYTELGVSPEKLVVAIPTFSITMKLCDRVHTGIGVEVCGEGDEGVNMPRWHRSLLYGSELLRKMSNTSEDWIVVRDQESMVPYAHSRSLLWGPFEDPESVGAKASFILKRNLAGAALMMVDMEDFRGQYTEGGQTFPLTRAAYHALNGDP